MIVPYGIDGASDRVARIVTTRLHEPVEIINRPGGGTIPGTLEAVRAAPDGDTLVLVTVTNWCIAPLLQPDLPFAPARDLAPLTLIGEAPNVLTVPAALDVHSVDEFVALARARPGALAYASAGSGQTIHLLAAAFANRLGLQIEHRPYAQGSSAAYDDLHAARVHCMVDSVVGALPSLQAGKLRALAVLAPARSALLPAVPTLAEAGVPGLEAPIWFGLATQSAVPASTLAALRADLAAACADATVQAGLRALGVTQAVLPLDSMIEASNAAWRAVIRMAGL